MNLARVAIISASLLAGCDRLPDDRLDRIEASLNRIEAHQAAEFPQLPAPMTETELNQMPVNTLFLAPDGSIRRKRRRADRE